MTPDELLKVNDLFRQYTQINHILEGLRSDTGYILQLRLEFKPSQEVVGGHAPYLPVPRDALIGMLEGMRNDLANKLLSLGVSV